MTETIVKCDICKSSANVKSYEVIVGQEPDPSGNGYEYKYLRFDFCLKHLIEYARKHPDQNILENFQNKNLTNTH